MNAVVLYQPEVHAPLPLETNDEKLVDLWLHGRPKATIEAYRSEVRRFRAFVGKPHERTTLADLQDFADSLTHLSHASQVRALAVVKSLFAFGHRLGYLPFDVARPLRLPKLSSNLAERILGEAEVHRMLALETNQRNHALLRLLYASAARVSEVCSLRWRDTQEREDGGQITVVGKGEKVRSIRLPATVWAELIALRGDAGPDAPVFRSRKGGHLDPSQVQRIVASAAKRAGIEGSVSPHWMRHSHASHALDRGCPIHLLQTTLGHESVATTGKYLHARPSESSGKYLAV